MTLPASLKNLTLRHDEMISIALWKTIKSLGATSFVLDDDDRFLGVLSLGDFPVYRADHQALRAGEICNRRGAALAAGPDLLLRAREIFERSPEILVLPVIETDGRPVDAIFKFQAFYSDYFREPERFHSLKPHIPTPGNIFPYMYYAWCLWQAAAEARRYGYERISALEFGVASGNGLICCERHALGIGRIFGLEIEVYGFDVFTGLPPAEDFRDMGYAYPAGAFKTEDYDLLKDRLVGAELVAGDIRETARDFFQTHRPAPVGVMLVDVDNYHASRAVLKMLSGDPNHFLPRVQMYFDDIIFGHECLGESLAVKDFNAEQADVRISPETTAGYPGHDHSGVMALNGFLQRCKVGHLFRHPLYNDDPHAALSAELSCRRFRTRY